MTAKQSAQRSKQSSRNARSGSSNKSKPAYHQAQKNVEQHPILDERTKRDIASVALIVVAIALFATVMMSPDGVVTGALSLALRFSLGTGMYVLPVLLIILAITFLIRFEHERVPARVAIGFALLFIAFLTITALFTPGAEEDPNMLFIQVYLVNHGGYVGAGIAWALLRLLGLTVSMILMVGLIVIAIIIIGFSFTSVYEHLRQHHTDRDQDYDNSDQARTYRHKAAPYRSVSPDKTADMSREKTHVLAQNQNPHAAKTQILNSQKEHSKHPHQEESDPQGEGPQTDNQQFLPIPGGTIFFKGKTTDTPKAMTRKLRSKPTTKEDSPNVSEQEEKSYKAPTTSIPRPQEGFELPDFSLLKTSRGVKSTQNNDAVLRETGMRLQETLADFGVNAQVVDWVHGPTVTLFKVNLPSGVRVHRVSNLTDDIALALAAPGVRIFAPVPGTNYVGIEVPNQERETVLLGDVLKDAPRQGSLQVVIGKDVEGKSIVSDLATMPHLLIGGTTGSGKSVCINAMIMSILMRATPSEVRMIMIDPKRVEFTPYNGIPHLYVPVVTEAREAASALSWAVAEMERRLKVFSSIGARNISQYNAKAQQGIEIDDKAAAEMPYIVIIIDELADLMMNVGKEVEFSISRLAQLARAAGIHLIVATQRPSTNVVTGLIKANITNRIAFNVASGIDSRVILDTPGAENLIGLGDLLLSKPELAKPQRIQGCFVSEEEITAVVEKLKMQGEPEYHNDILKTNLITIGDSSPDGSGGSGHSSDDPLVWDAAEIVVSAGIGSTSNLQRRLSIGYSRAGRIMDLLEEKGIVGPQNGSKPREVLVDAVELETLKAFEETDSQ